MKFVIHTQLLENYGAHSESGKFKDGSAFWKFKFGTTYVVSGLDRIQDAIAFVVSHLNDNNDICYKEYVSSHESYDQWFDRTDDEEKEWAVYVDPNNYDDEVDGF